jgi:DNA-directed RNA polymerase alpha subunit
MKFTHLVQINDITNPLIDELTREQLWAGLKLRARDPSQFVIGLDSFHLVARSENELVRELRFGHLTVRDHVSFTPMSNVRYEIEPAGEVPAATLVTTIEEPEPGQLFVRFAYDTRPVEGGPPVDPYYQEFVKEAYKEADIDAIRIIRRLITEGLLDGGPTH